MSSGLRRLTLSSPKVLIVLPGAQDPLDGGMRTPGRVPEYEYQTDRQEHHGPPDVGMQMLQRHRLCGRIKQMVDACCQNHDSIKKSGTLPSFPIGIPIYQMVFL